MVHLYKRYSGHVLYRNNLEMYLPGQSRPPLSDQVTLSDVSRVSPSPSGGPRTSGVIRLDWEYICTQWGARCIKMTGLGDELSLRSSAWCRHRHCVMLTMPGPDHTDDSDHGDHAPGVSEQWQGGLQQPPEHHHPGAGHPGPPQHNRSIVNKHLVVICYTFVTFVKTLAWKHSVPLDT